jgi:hypothetical protein
MPKLSKNTNYNIEGSKTIESPDMLGIPQNDNMKYFDHKIDTSQRLASLGDVRQAKTPQKS